MRRQIPACCQNTDWTLLIVKSNFAQSTDIFNCKTQIQSNTLTYFEVPISANFKFLICDYTFALMCKCRCQFEVFTVKTSPIILMQISILAICTYISEKKVIAK